MDDNPKVLIVDDRVENLITLETILRPLEAEIVRAASGNEALAMSLEHDFALALVDVQMPDMDGYETVSLMRQDRKTELLPVIFISAVHSGKYHQIKGVEVGAVDFIEKPLNRELLLGKVRNFLELYRHRRMLEDFNRELETRVEDRTVKLQETNENLKKEMAKREIIEKQLRQAHKMEAIGTLAGGIAHEFNNILGIIIGNTDLALDEIPERNPAADCIKEIRTASMRAKEVVRKLLRIARKTPTLMKPIQIGTTIKESMDLMRRTIPSSIDIRQNIRCSKEMISGDNTEISQIIMNLCNNSVHAMVSGKGVLEVALETITLDSRSSALYENIGPGTYVKLTVSDNGTGIPPDILDRIFEPYFTTKDVDEGLGMGLAVVHGIVKKHGGDIKVESEFGKGTIVKVLFPLINEQPLPGDQKTGTLPTGTERILFVDDEASLVKMFTQMLIHSGYEVIGKTSSTEALNVFKENPDRFDLVITDMTMPEMTGDEIARQIIQIRPDIPIILCTGHSNRMDENKAKQTGIKAFASKPLERKELIEMVRKILDEAKGQGAPCS